MVCCTSKFWTITGAWRILCWHMETVREFWNPTPTCCTRGSVQMSAKFDSNKSSPDEFQLLSEAENKRWSFLWPLIVGVPLARAAIDRDGSDFRSLAERY